MSDNKLVRSIRKVNPILTLFFLFAVLLSVCQAADYPNRAVDIVVPFAPGGVDIIGRNMTSRRDALILAASLGVGLGIQAAPPGAFDAIPQALRILVTDGIVMGILLAMVLNLVFPKEQ